MEERLRPVNSLISLVTPADPVLPALAVAGFRLVALETPVTSLAGTVVIDVVLLHEATGQLVLCEVKSGANIETEQARRYNMLSAGNVVRAARVTVRGEARPVCEVIYVCTEPNTDRVTRGLDSVGLNFPLLVVGSTEARLIGRGSVSATLATALHHGSVRLPHPVPIMIPFDHETPSELIVADVQAGLVSCLAHRE